MGVELSGSEEDIFTVSKGCAPSVRLKLHSILIGVNANVV
jgi:hypothetical protein